jgi:hypothetical protein
MFWTILTGALGGLSLGTFSMWNTYKQIDLHNQKLERMAKSKTDSGEGKE